MNSSKTNNILNEIKTNVSNVDTTSTNNYAQLQEANNHLTTSKSYLSALVTNGTSVLLELGDIDGNTSNINNTLTSTNSILTNNGVRQYNIQTELETINEKLVDIGVTLQPKQTFCERMGWDSMGGSLWLNIVNTSNHHASYQNTSGKPMYLTGIEMVYIVTETSNPGEWVFNKIFNNTNAGGTLVIGKSDSDDTIDDTIWQVSGNYYLRADC